MAHGTSVIQRFGGFGWLLGIALCHGGLLADAARASCGDYVTVGGPNSIAPHRSFMPQADDAPAPCSGPHCSRRAPSPPESPAPLLSTGAHDWLAIASSSDAEPLVPLRARSFAQEPRCFFWATGIFRPPRQFATQR
jgi:hypothetical protein